MHIVFDGGEKLDAVVAGGVAIISFIVWLVRLESKSNSSSENLKRVEARLEQHADKIANLDEKVMDKLSHIEMIVANIQGQLSK